MKLFQLRVKASSKRHNLGEINAFTPPHYKGLIDRFRVNNPHCSQSILSRCFGLWSVLFVLVSWSVFLPATVSAQEVFTCPATANTENNSGLPSDSSRIVCKVTDKTNADDITIAVSNRDISILNQNINPSNLRGIWGEHAGPATIDITMTGGSITTQGNFSSGIRGERKGTGKGDINITMNGGSITTGEITVNDGLLSHGIYGKHDGKGEGAINILMTGGKITTHEAQAHGIWGEHKGTGDIAIRVVRATIIAEQAANPNDDTSGNGIKGQHLGDGNISISVSGGSITTEGTDAPGISGEHLGSTGNVGITVSGGSITTTGADRSYGIYGVQNSADNVGITVSGGSISTTGLSTFHT